MVTVGPGGGLGDLRFEMGLVRRERMERRARRRGEGLDGRTEGGEVWRGEAEERLNLRCAARRVGGFING
jgi:hypothetical protein